MRAPIDDKSCLKIKMCVSVFVGAIFSFFDVMNVYYGYL